MDNDTTTREEAPISTESPKPSKTKKNGLPWWGWAIIVILPIIALFSLPIIFGDAPEQSRYANKNKTIAKVNPKNNPQQNVKPKTNVANLNKNKNNKTNTNRPNNASKPTNTTLNKGQNVSSQTNNRPNNNQQNNQIPITQPNNTAANTLAIQNNTNTKTNKNIANANTNTKVQNSSTQNKITKQTAKPKNQAQQKPVANTNAVKNIKNTVATPAPKPNTQNNTNTNKSANTSNVKSSYKGSASKVDIAAQTNATKIINFGTVTNDDKLLTPSAYSNFIKIAKILQNNPKATITIRTHNRNFNHNPSNQKAKQQGQVRAGLLKKVLVDSGVNANRVNVELVGHVEPLIEQDPSHVRNRRVSVKIN